MIPAAVARDARADVKPNSLAPMAFLAPSPPSLLVYADQASMATALTSFWLTEGIPALWRRTSTRTWSELLVPVIVRATSLTATWALEYAALCESGGSSNCQQCMCNLAKVEPGSQCPEVLAPWQVVGQVCYGSRPLSHIPSNVCVVRCRGQPAVYFTPRSSNSAAAFIREPLTLTPTSSVFPAPCENISCILEALRCRPLPPTNATNQPADISSLSTISSFPTAQTPRSSAYINVLFSGLPMNSEMSATMTRNRIRPSMEP
jgi:hypothetical protein